MDSATYILYDHIRNTRFSDIATIHIIIIIILLLILTYQGPGLPVFTFSYMHVRVCVYITAFARVSPSCVHCTNNAYTMTLPVCTFTAWCLLSMPVCTFTGAYYLCQCVRSLVVSTTSLNQSIYSRPSGWIWLCHLIGRC